MPEPLGQITELLQGLTQVQEDLEGIYEDLRCDRERRGVMLRECEMPRGHDVLNVTERPDYMDEYGASPFVI